MQQDRMSSIMSGLTGYDMKLSAQPSLHDAKNSMLSKSGILSQGRYNNSNMSIARSKNIQASQISI